VQDVLRIFELDKIFFRENKKGNKKTKKQIAIFHEVQTEILIVVLYLLVDE
jgi:hypothetical protein